MPKSVHTPAYKLFLGLLRQQRERLGIKQRALGRTLDVHHTYVNLCESGERQLNIVELRQWCQGLGISFPDFVKDLDEALSQQEKEEAQSAPPAAQPSASHSPNPKP
jgi:transcriptional regulator with XRE-family HTH domain